MRNLFFQIGENKGECIGKSEKDGDDTDEWMEEYKREYKNFSKCYFAKNLRIPGVKEHLLKTLAQINGYKDKIEKTPIIIKIFMVDLVNNYLKFLDMSDVMCQNFLKRL